MQLSRLRHTVKVAILAQVGPSRRPVRRRRPLAAVHSAAVLRAWIATQPWVQPGPKGWVYLLCFRDPTTGDTGLLQGQGCRGQYAGHYCGRAASSGLLKVLRRTDGAEFAEFA